MQEKFLITGGAGFIGSRLVNLLSKDNKVIVIDNLTTGDINYIQMNDNIQFINGSILDFEIFERDLLGEIFFFL